MLQAFETQMLFPAPTLPLAWLSAQARLQKAEEVQVRTSDGIALYGWYLRTSQPRRGVVLWFDGNGMSVAMRPMEFALLREEGWDIVHVNYRGYPGSEGQPSEVGLRRDARAIWDYAAAIDPRIWVIGKSLGGGVAVGLAAERPAALLTVESTFACVAELANTLFRFPVSGLMVNRFDSLALAPQVRAPSLVIHGTYDELIPLDHGKRLAAALNAEFMPIPGAGHNNALLLEHWEQVRAWMEKHLGGP